MLLALVSLVLGAALLLGASARTALAESAAAPAFILIPKVRTRHSVDLLRRALGETAPPLWALMETPEALRHIDALADSVGGKGGIVFGGADFSAAIGSDMSWDALYFARSALIAGAGAACQTLDVPYLDVRDIDGLVAETRRVKAMGFSGRSCIHPDQVAPINEIFTPTAAEIGRRPRLAVEPQPNPLRRRVGAVTLPALVGQNRAHVPIELDAPLRRRTLAEPARHHPQKHQRQNGRRPPPAPHVDPRPSRPHRPHRPHRPPRHGWSSVTHRVHTFVR